MAAVLLPASTAAQARSDSTAASTCAVLAEPELARGATTPPRPVHPPLVAYPTELALRSNDTDSARARFVVARDGTVPECSVSIDAISDSILRPFVSPAVSKLAFMPAMHGDQPSPAWVTMTVFFRSTDRVRAATRTKISLVVEQLPRLLAGAPAPTYPRELLAAGVAGHVVLAVTITPAGRIDPQSVRVVTSNDARFTIAVKAVLSRMRFEPARLGPDGPAIATQLQLPFDFQPPRER